MKIILLAVGKQDSLFQEAVQEFTKRIRNYSDFELIETTDEKLEQQLEKYDRIFLLDDKGTSLTTEKFAQFIERELSIGGKNMCFVIGGAYGFPDAVRNKARNTISLSKLTFPHQLVRAIFLEQLYRAFTVIRNEKYHH